MVTYNEYPVTFNTLTDIDGWNGYPGSFTITNLYDNNEATGCVSAGGDAQVGAHFTYLLDVPTIPANQDIAGIKFVIRVKGDSQTGLRFRYVLPSANLDWEVSFYVYDYRTMTGQNIFITPQPLADLSSGYIVMDITSTAGDKLPIYLAEVSFYILTLWNPTPWNQIIMGVDGSLFTSVMGMSSDTIKTIMGIEAIR